MNSRPAIAVDFGGTTIKIGVTCGSDILEKAQPLPTPAYGSPEEIMDAMCATMKGLRDRHPDVCAVGLGMPGWVDFYKGVLYQLTNVAVWNREVPVRDVMQQQLGLPVVLDNDANCMGYAEWKLGAGQGLESLVCLTLGTGIGGAVIVHNRLLRGRNVSSGELGQTSIHFRGRVGPFGNRGAIEEYIGNNELAAEAVARYAAAGVQRPAEDCTPYKLELAARAGDAIAKGLYDEFAEMLACLVMNMMYAVVPDAFIIGGGVAKAGDLLFEPLRARLHEQLFRVHDANLRLLPACFGSDAGLIGAGLMAQHYADGTLL
ncbi:MAG TPA: ROK family protein [Candidatus Akkermansia intestinigallinarum]|uniref:ROK family protein n=1 Tax=Candidatus Akkermansia intestinigallinarum TaxID=2838431 RepID=A0A9D2AHX4_9BACT|nr:ROK family protein [Candidatus Akkermansia intestinigallinarum]